MKFGLSRSTLLYYDKIGLLKPSERSGANYRHYTDVDVQTLEKICLYRKTGVGLQRIKELLTAPDHSVWEDRLIQINAEIESLRIQQNMILEILDHPETEGLATLFTADRFSRLLQSIGWTHREMQQFHVKLEQSSSNEHRSFLRFLGLSDHETQKLITTTKDAINQSLAI